MDISVSVIIPARNEKEYIGKCLDSFVDQSYPKRLFEILVCDGMSTDGTRDIVMDYEREHGNIHLIDNPGLSAPKGMNAGIRNSVSDIVIIFGAHAYADRDFISNNVKLLRSSSAGCTGGPIETISENDKGRAIALAMSSPFGVGNALFRYCKSRTYVDTVAFGAYWRKVIEGAGCFDEELVRTQDYELNLRITEKGYKILLSPEIKSFYYSRSSYKKVWKQYFQYGFWKVRVVKKHGRVASARHLIPLLFVLFNVFGPAIGIFIKPVFILWLTGVLLYLCSDIVSSFMLAKKDINIVKYIIPVFPILHISYGLGFLQGLMNFYVSKSEDALEKNIETSR